MVYDPLGRLDPVRADETGGIRGVLRVSLIALGLGALLRAVSELRGRRDDPLSLDIEGLRRIWLGARAHRRFDPGGQIRTLLEELSVDTSFGFGGRGWWVGMSAECAAFLPVAVKRLIGRSRGRGPRLGSGRHRRMR